MPRGQMAPSEELRRSGLALMHSPLSTCGFACVRPRVDGGYAGLLRLEHDCPSSYCLTF